MIRLKVSAKGLERVKRAFARLDQDMAAAANESIYEAGKAVAADAKSLAPADTGAYRKGIRSIFVRNARSPFAKVASFFKGRPSPIGHLVEFGHRDATTGRFIAGKSHLLAALDRHKSKIAERIRRGIAR